MKRRLLFCAFALFLLSLNVNCDELPISSWAPFSGVTNMTLHGGILSLTSMNQLPLVQSKGDLFINAYSMRTIKMKMKADKSYSTARIFFKRIGDRDFSYQASVDFLTGRSNKFHEYTVDVGRNPMWFGTITQLMFSPISDRGNVDIEYIRIAKPGMFPGFSSFLRDLFAFEVPQLRTVNFIYGPRISGLSINYYIYAFILLASIIIFVIEYLKTGSANASLRNTSKNIVIICLIFWILLDIRTLLDQGRTVLLENETYGGRPLAERHEAATLGDFYPFISFCNSKIPSGSSYSGVFPTYYYFSSKAAYYLYPTHSKENADYVIVYDPDKTLGNEISKYRSAGYKTFATLKEGEFILKK